MIRFLKTKQFTLLLHFIIWGSLILLPLLISIANSDGHTLLFDHFFYTTSNLLNAGLFYFNVFWLYPKLAWKGHWFYYLVAILATIVVAYMLKMFIGGWWQGAHTLDHAMRPAAFFSGVVCVLISLIYRLVLDNRRRERIQKEKQAQQQATELKFLRSQINPHFLFNVLNNMVSLARQKSDQLEPSLLMLSGIMRYMLYDSDTSKVPLAKEMEYLRNYIALQQLRFADQVEIETEISVEESNSSIEPMLLIAFVENAFKHGTGLVPDPYIRIRAQGVDGVLNFEVTNTYNPQEGGSKDRSSGIGLQNVKARLQLLYPERHQLTIHPSNGLFNVSLTLHLS